MSRRLREIRRGFRDPTWGLKRTHTIAVGTLATSTRFPDPSRDRDITVEMRGVAGSASQNALVFIGGTSINTRGLYMGFLGTGLLVAVGAGSGTAANNVLSTTTGDLITGRAYQLVVSARPGRGEVRAWLDGQLILRAQASSGSFGGSWAGTLNGLVSASGSAIISRVTAYVGQLPRHFDSTPA